MKFFVLRKYLEELGISQKNIEKIERSYTSVEEFLKDSDESISKLLDIDKKEVEALKKKLSQRISGGKLIEDFLKRWGKVTSQNDARRAYEEYTKLGELYPNSPAIWAIKAQLLEKMNRLKEARKAYEKAHYLYLQRGEIPPPELENKIRELKSGKHPILRVEERVSFHNGMINGFKNGLVNGTGLINGIKGGAPSPRERKNPWRFMVSIAIILLIIFAPLLTTTFLLHKEYIYQVDGNFQEWRVEIPYYSLQKASKDINIEYVKFHPADNGIYFYIKTMSKKAFLNSTGIYIFIDTDNSTSTGYLVGGTGADYMAELYGWNSTLRGKNLYFFNSTHQEEFSGFHQISSIAAILEGNNIEGFMKIPSSNFRAIVISSDYAFSEDIVPCPFYGKPGIIVKEGSSQYVLPPYKLSPLVKIHILGDSKIHSLTFKIYGNAPPSHMKFYLYLDNGNDILDEEDILVSSMPQILNSKLIFSNLNLTVSNSTLFVGVIPDSSPEKTLMVKIEEIEADAPYFIDNQILQAAYIEKIPSVPKIDGCFLDWKNVKKDAPRDVQLVGKINAIDPNIDLLNYSAYDENNSLLIYLQVRGKLLGGTDIPTIKIPTPPDSDRDTVPDKFDLYPHDFNNDGVPDDESYVMINGIKYPDVDGDSIPDYPEGNDMWLNTTIPSNFPKPYAGRHVRIYIGPVPHRKIYGTDTINIYIDADGDKTTGFSLPQYPFGAEYKIELVGREGQILNSSIYQYHNGNWIMVRNLDSQYYAIGYHAIELSSVVSGKNIMITISNWRGDRDAGDKTLSTAAKFFDSMNLTFTYQNIGIKFGDSLHSKDTSMENLRSSITLRTLFGTDVLVSNITNSNKRNETHPSIVRTEDGTLWVTWSFKRGNGNNDIAIAYSTDGGKTWKGWKIYRNKSFDTPNPVIVKDANDNLFIFFENHTSGAYFQFLYHSNGDTSKNWILYGFPSISWENIYNISAAAYSNSIYVVFEYHNVDYGSTIGYLFTSNGGSSWRWRIWDMGSWSGHPSVTISTGSNPRVFIAFDYYNTTGLLSRWEVVVLNNSEIGNNSWRGYEYWSIFSYKYPSIYASGDNIYVVWEEGFTIFDWDYWDLIFLKSTDNGLTWSNPTSIDTAATWDNDEEYPWVVANGQDVYIFYLNSTRGYICMVESHDGGNTWSDAVVVSDESSGESIYRTVSAIYSEGGLYVVWTDERSGKGDIYFDKVPELQNIIIVPLLVAFIVMLSKRKKKHERK